MNRIIICQVIWVALGILYNLASLVVVKAGGTKLAPTDPISGLAFIIIAAVIVLAGILGFRRIYIIAILPIIGLLAYSGVFLHISNLVSDASLPGYYSTLSWCLAIGINLFGLIALTIACWLPN